MIGVLVHGGAGAIAEERHDVVLAGCRAAAEAGRAVLAAGGSALDAVQVAVRALEDNPEFNAGTGSVLTRAGTIEVDAAIMSGDGRVGACAAVPDLPHAVDLARAVMDDGEHVILAGPAAWEFALAHGFARAAPGAMITPRARQRFEDARAARVKETSGGTVGAVAFDAQGRVAAATSTGGINYKRPGRVGDSPVPGAGTWADERAGAASATGDGEAILRVTLTRQLVDRIAAGAAPSAAAEAAIGELVARTGGGAGAICVDRDGRFGAWHSTAVMPVALAAIDDGGGERTIAVIRPAAELAAAIAS
jgi:beta-aspartyl-peptidase (threonine type)